MGLLAQQKAKGLQKPMRDDDQGKKSKIARKPKVVEEKQIYWREATFLEAPKPEPQAEDHQDEETKEKLEDPETQGQSGVAESDLKGKADKEIPLNRVNY